MEYNQALKITKTIIKYIGGISYEKQKEIKYEIIRYNYINQNIRYKNIINIGLKELKKNKYNFIDLEKIIKSYYGKTTRIKKRINKMNKNKIWFGTYTINDNSMNKNHIRKLKELNKNNNYIINVDYGAKNNRKHYHAIIESEKEPKAWEYGFCKFIKVENINDIAMAKYINKITNHTIKTTAEKIIYSRRKNH